MKAGFRRLNPAFMLFRATPSRAGCGPGVAQGNSSVTPESQECGFRVRRFVEIAGRQAGTNSA